MANDKDVMEQYQIATANRRRMEIAYELVSGITPTDMNPVQSKEWSDMVDHMRSMLSLLSNMQQNLMNDAFKK